MSNQFVVHQGIKQHIPLHPEHGCTILWSPKLVPQTAALHTWSIETSSQCTAEWWIDHMGWSWQKPLLWWGMRDWHLYIGTDIVPTFQIMAVLFTNIVVLQTMHYFGVEGKYTRGNSVIKWCIQMWHGMVRHFATDMCPHHGNAKGHFKYSIQLPTVSCQPLSNEMLKCVLQVCLASVICFPAWCGVRGHVAFGDGHGSKPKEC